MLGSMRTYSLHELYAARKRRDSWWTVYAVDPVACRVALVVANRTRWTPNQLTVSSLVLGMASAASLATNHLVVGAVFFYLSFMVDCVDGKIARLKGTGTPFGLWLDYVGDRVRVVFCAAGLAFGQYSVTGDVDYILLGAGVAVLDLFRYVNAPQMKRVRETIREAKAEAAAAAQLEAAELEAAELEADVEAGAETDVEMAVGVAAGVAVGVAAGVAPAPPWERRRPNSKGRSLLKRFNKGLARRRVRSHLISGIEFHAAVFVIAPLGGPSWLIPVAVVASTLLLANEVVLVYRMWLFTRRHSVPSRESREHVLV
jgi:phosphatidylglycerophosphate synthase